MKRGNTIAKRKPLAVAVQPVVGPIPDTDNWRTICRNLDTIYEAHDDGVYKGLCRRNWGRLDHSLAKIERSAKSARALLRPNVSVLRTAHLVRRTEQRIVGSYLIASERISLGSIPALTELNLGAIINRNIRSALLIYWGSK